MITYKEGAKRLKKLGLIDYDLRKPLSPGQKSNITRLENKFKPILNSPDNYSSRVISTKRAENIGGESFKIKTSKGRKGKTRVYFLGKITEVSRDSITVERKKEDILFTNKIYDTQKGDIYTRIKLTAKKLKPDEFLTITLGGSQFNTKWVTPQQLDAYLQDWIPKDVDSKHKEYKNYLLDKMVVTKVTLPENAAVLSKAKNAAKKKGTAKNRRNRR